MVLDYWRRVTYVDRHTGVIETGVEYYDGEGNSVVLPGWGDTSHEAAKSVLELRESERSRKEWIRQLAAEQREAESRVRVSVSELLASGMYERKDGMIVLKRAYRKDGLGFL